MKPILKTACLNSIATAGYVSLVGFSMFYSGKLNFVKEPTPFIPIFMLMLLVFSVALVGTLMFGKPILWYLDGKKKEALELLMYTLGIFFGIVMLAFVCMIFWNVR